MRKKKNMIQAANILVTGALAFAVAPGLMPVCIVAAETVTETVKEVNSTGEENSKKTQKEDSTTSTDSNASKGTEDGTTSDDTDSVLANDNDSTTDESTENLGTQFNSDDSNDSLDDSSVDTNGDASSADNVATDSQDSQEDAESYYEDPAVPTEEEKETKEKKWYHMSIIDVAAQLTFAFIVALIGYGIFVRSKK